MFNVWWFMRKKSESVVSGALNYYGTATPLSIARTGLVLRL